MCYITHNLMKNSTIRQKAELLNNKGTLMFRVKSSINYDMIRTTDNAQLGQPTTSLVMLSYKRNLKKNVTPL